MPSQAFITFMATDPRPEYIALLKQKRDWAMRHGDKKLAAYYTQLLRNITGG